MPTMHMMIGNVGCGKSLISQKLSKLYNTVVFNMDTYQEMLSGGIYGAYDNAKKDIYREGEEATIRSTLQHGVSLVIDRTNMDRKRRKRFLDIGEEFGVEIVAYDFGAGSDDDLMRRCKNPRGVPVEIWKEVFEHMKGSYEPPEKEKGFSSVVIPPACFHFYAFDFDGTIVENNFPTIGEIIDGTVDKLNRLYSDLANISIIWTCRSGNYENQARHFLLKNKIPFDFINENPLFDTGSPKIFAHEYHDDRNSIELGA